MLNTKGLTGHFGEKVVSIFVGSKRKKWVIHRDLICHRAPFFKNALTGVFFESGVESVYLKDDHSGGFEIFVYWLDRDCLPTLEPGSGTCIQQDHSAQIPGLCIFYLQAYKFLLPPSVKAAALNMLLTIRRKSITPASPPTSLSLITYTLANTAEDDPLRTLLLDFACADYVNNVAFVKQFDAEDNNKDSHFDAFGFLKAYKARHDLSNALGVCDVFFDPGTFYTSKSHEKLEKISRYQTGFLAPTSMKRCPPRKI